MASQKAFNFPLCLEHYKRIPFAYIRYFTKNQDWIPNDVQSLCYRYYAEHFEDEQIDYNEVDSIVVVCRLRHTTEQEKKTEKINEETVNDDFKILKDQTGLMITMPPPRAHQV